MMGLWPYIHTYIHIYIYIWVITKHLWGSCYSLIYWLILYVMNKVTCTFIRLHARSCAPINIKTCMLGNDLWVVENMCKLLIVRRYKKLHVRDCAAQRTSVNGKFVGSTLYVHKGDTIIDSLLMFITRAIITN